MEKSNVAVHVGFLALLLLISGLGVFLYADYASVKNGTAAGMIAETGYPSQAICESSTDLPCSYIECLYGDCSKKGWFAYRQITPSFDVDRPVIGSVVELGVTPSSRVFDFAVCDSSNDFSVTTSQSSLTIHALSKESDKCSVTVVEEVKGVFSEYQCNLPQTFGQVTFIGTDFSIIDPYCKLVRKGNLLIQ